MENHILVGKTITGVHLAEDRLAIRFDIQNSEPVVARVDADCCSYTWVENIEAPEVLIGSPVLVAENLELTRESENTEDGLLQFYGFKIVTAKGTCTIDYRNSSNGYYGGSLEWPGNDYYYGGVYQQAISKEKWNQIAG